MLVTTHRFGINFSTKSRPRTRPHYRHPSKQLRTLISQNSQRIPAEMRPSLRPKVQTLRHAGNVTKDVIFNSLRCHTYPICLSSMRLLILLQITKQEPRCLRSNQRLAMMTWSPLNQQKKIIFNKRNRVKEGSRVCFHHQTRFKRKKTDNDENQYGQRINYKNHLQSSLNIYTS